jgi:hydrogenase maturation factor
MADDDQRLIPTGKIQPALLAEILSLVRRPDPGVMVGPSHGEDAAVVRWSTGSVVVTSDPITFPTPEPGYYAVHINANDIAVMGGVPRYLTLTLLLPVGATVGQLRQIVRQAAVAADALGIRIVGGHTEVTPAVVSPVLGVTLVGELLLSRPLRTGDGRAGDAVIQVNPMAIEGTSILATEYRQRLAGQIDPLVLSRAEAFLRDPGISVVAAARLAAEALPVRAMHDPTEGGIATGLREIAVASGTGLRVFADRLIAADETRLICRALGHDPLGLISSGCLLFTVPGPDAARAVSLLADHGYRVAHIGLLTPEPGQYWLELSTGETRPLPEFAVDELAMTAGG